MIIAQHGTLEAPHVYLEVSQREHYSQTLDKHFRHTVLSIGYHYEGPTEIGGLVVDPDFRGQGKPGKQLSYARFLFMAMHSKRFRDRVLAELLPPLLPDGRSLLWEALGRKFTGLTYQEAYRLSRQNKEFIKELFPAERHLRHPVLSPARPAGDRAGRRQRPSRCSGCSNASAFATSSASTPSTAGRTSRPPLEEHLAGPPVPRGPARRARAQERLRRARRTPGRGRAQLGQEPLPRRAHPLPCRWRDGGVARPRRASCSGRSPGDKLHLVPFE